MKHWIDRLLIGILWTLAILLAGAFWFGNMFSFDILSADAWRFLANTQTTARITASFYIAFFVFIAVYCVGLYFIARPHRTIKNIATENYLDKPSPLPLPATEPGTQNEYRPHAMHAQPRNLAYENLPKQDVNMTAQTTTSVPTRTTDYPGRDEINDIITLDGYTLKTPPKIGDFTPDIWAIGADETLVIGAAVRPGEDTNLIVNTLATAMGKVATLFADTLDEDIKITIKSFVIDNNTNSLYTREIPGQSVLVFNGIDELRAYFDANKSGGIDDEEDKENFDAYADYIDTVANYFNG